MSNLMVELIRTTANRFQL